jgi:thioredoxin reductase
LISEKSACIIGGGDVAYDYALSLANRGMAVKLVMRSVQPRCLELLRRRVQQKSNIEIMLSALPVGIAKHPEGLSMHLRGSTSTSLACDLILIGIGREPNLDFMAEELCIGRQAPPGLYFAGDAVNGSFRQVGIAVGDGLRCAMEITRQKALSHA